MDRPACPATPPVPPPLRSAARRRRLAGPFVLAALLVPAVAGAELEPAGAPVVTAPVARSARPVAEACDAAVLQLEQRATSARAGGVDRLAAIAAVREVQASLAAAAAPARAPVLDALEAAAADLAEAPEAELRERVPGELAYAARSLAAGCAALRGGAREVPHDPARLREILARPDFARAEVDERSGRRLLAALLDALGELLGGETAYAAATSGRAIFLGLLAGLLAAWTLSLVRRKVAARRPAAGVREDEAIPLEAPEAYRARAVEALAAGRHREAIRASLLASLAALERAHLIRPGRTRTNRECAADLARRGAPRELEARFSELIRRFDRAFYGLGAVAAEDARALAALSDDVVRLARGPAAESGAGGPR